MTADGLTKALLWQKFEEFVRQLGLEAPPPKINAISLQQEPSNRTLNVRGSSDEEEPAKAPERLKTASSHE